MNTAEDHLRFSAMLSQNGVFEGRRDLSAKAVGYMLTDQKLKAQMTPTGANLLPDAHCSLGSWCETWDANDACVRNSSIGLNRPGIRGGCLV